MTIAGVPVLIWASFTSAGLALLCLGVLIGLAIENNPSLRRDVRELAFAELNLFFVAALSLAAIAWWRV